jgi:hypothetical protein
MILSQPVSEFIPNPEGCHRFILAERKFPSKCLVIPSKAHISAGEIKNEICVRSTDRKHHGNACHCKCKKPVKHISSPAVSVCGIRESLRMNKQAIA